MTIRTIVAFVGAAVLEIAGCYSAWMWLRLGKSPLWLVPGAVALVLFAVTLTQVEAAFAGRAYAAYGGVYIIAALAWARIVEHRALNLTDFLGGILCLAGAFVILLGRRG